jgi:S1-C subfamily serine protease
MKAFLSFIATVMASTLLTIAVGVGHGIYEESKYPTIEQQMKNVVAITTEGAYCSGWVLKGTHQVVTAAHCAPDDVTAVLNVDFGDGVKHPFHIQHKGDTSFATGPDLMTLTTSDTTIHWPVGEAVCTFKPYYGEALTMFGGPLGFSWTAMFGIVSNPKPDFTRIETEGMEIPKYAHNFIQYSGDMQEGNSGGMVTDDEVGCVMGVAETAIIQNISRVNFLTPASDLKEIIK